MQPTFKIFVTGQRGLVDSALVRKLRKKRFENFVLKPRSELDLTDQPVVEQFFMVKRPEYLFLAAVKMGGIHANNIFRRVCLQQHTGADERHQ